MDKKWIFADAGIGPYSGFNNAAIDHFRKDNSIYREVLQNSLDNKDGTNDEPVIVEFRKMVFSAADLGINNDLKNIINYAEKWSENADKKDIKNFYSQAQKVIDQKKVEAFVISDFNTVGLYRHPHDRKSNFFRLVLNPGASKSTGDGGGSHGHGQHAAYAKSDLRSVFIHSYVSDGIKGTSHNRLCIGKIILNAWDDPDNPQLIKRETGFFGILDNKKIMPFFDNEVPKQIAELRKTTGTDILIIAPSKHSIGTGWTYTAMTQVVEHFFAAIEENKLVVKLHKKNEVNTINADSLDEAVVSSQNKRVEKYLEALRQTNEKYIFTRKIEELGEVVIKIAFHNKGTQKIVLLRRPRMKLFEYNKPVFPNYSGVIIIDDKTGNDIIRNLEDPEHKKFEISREEDLYPGKGYLKKIETFIDETLEELNKNRIADPIVIPGLGNLLPSEEDIQREGDSDSDSEEMDTSRSDQIEIDFTGNISQYKPTISNIAILGGYGKSGAGGGKQRQSKKKGGFGSHGDSGGTDDGSGMSILNSITMRSFLSTLDQTGNTYKCVVRVEEDCEGYLGINAIGVDGVTIRPNVIQASAQKDGKLQNLKILNSSKMSMGKLIKGDKVIIEIKTNLRTPAAITASN